MLCTSSNTSYNVLIHSHFITWGLSQFVREGGGGPVNILGRAYEKRESLQILDL